MGCLALDRVAGPTSSGHHGVKARFLTESRSLSLAFYTMGARRQRACSRTYQIITAELMGGNILWHLNVNPASFKHATTDVACIMCVGDKQKKIFDHCDVCMQSHGRTKSW